MTFRKSLFALLLMMAASLAFNGCVWGESPSVVVDGGGGGTEADGLYGTLADLQGTRLANARVRVFPDTVAGLAKTLDALEAQSAIRDSARTDAKGFYHIDSLPEGTYALLASTVRHDTTLTALVRGIVHDGGKRNLGELTLRPGGRITLRVRVDGQAVEGARCTIEGLEEFSAASSASGTCILSGLPEGTYRVSVEHPTQGFGRTDTVKVKSGSTTNGGTLDLEAAGPPSSSTALTAVADAPVVYPSPVSADYNGLMDLNGGAIAAFGVGSYDVSSSARVLVRFRLPQGLAPSRISKAVIRMNVRAWILKNVQGSVRIDAHRVLRPWTEGSGLLERGVPNSASINGVTARERFWTSDSTALWNQVHVGLDNIDASASPVASTTQPSRTSFVWEWDVTALARDWAADSTNNFGVIFLSAYPLANSEVRDYPDFLSREAAVADSLKPRLLLEFSN